MKFFKFIASVCLGTAAAQYSTSTVDARDGDLALEHSCTTGVDNRQSMVAYLMQSLQAFEEGTAGQPYTFVFTYEKDGTQYCPKKLTVVNDQVTAVSSVSSQQMPTSTGASDTSSPACTEQADSEYMQMTVPAILNHMLAASETAYRVCWNSATNVQTGERSSRGFISQSSENENDAITFSIDNIAPHTPQQGEGHQQQAEEAHVDAQAGQQRGALRGSSSPSPAPASSSAADASTGSHRRLEWWPGVAGGIAGARAGRRSYTTVGGAVRGSARGALRGCVAGAIWDGTCGTGAAEGATTGAVTGGIYGGRPYYRYL
uniref:Uncharacterized protein n=1 Tax=Chromera velia CCMP2878 TaxID=1169474 RepID=A0A0G4F6A6_9ALVE|mmetsp:Transcript_27460/g.53893  ORF Transcript_27460/g.53893 Transcript_27460/m.53893 type:complete len:317 (-) Transcript_27460:1034-1984(-)|eukprot:Cvel_15419.t1-p1 / transcript=Cvel_15419.t1 / gene=Cvel_15419 / organism=Chromera_velia_CCMP2878 / gene_product=hypothetical protein / transcript_product=hypothetical protein / location=Cvel_scaffold1139:34177-35716(+) / protein_length=316 / sequence_SO=supercontig / SO=protein_coding / is_pseudo=false